MALNADPETAQPVIRQSARPQPLRWSLVIPVKVLTQAKSRLIGIEDQRRSELALAMAADTIAAAVSAPPVSAVLVVTDDPAVTDIAAGLGALVVPDAPAAGLNEALTYGAAVSEATWPERGRAGLAGDLPAARPEELTAALAAAARLGAAFVPDADGTGTVLYAAAPGSEFRPQFGPASREKHLASGAVEIGTVEIGTGDGRPGRLAGLRRDVDTMEDLQLAAEIGLGPRTRELLARFSRTQL
jgi:2-phospho-L-lactate/phosphoenolpyruvate guanylyltransferase